MTATRERARSGPCVGIRALDLSTMVSGPMAGQILADLGADVIKLEPPSGDMLRTVAPVYRGVAAYFQHFNRNKRSAAVDMKDERGRDLVKAVAAEVDVLIENFRPGVADRLGLGYEALKTLNPKLIYVSINGFGDDGPYRDQPAYDMVIQGLTGFMPAQGGDGPPAAVRAPLVDKIAAMSAAMATLAALLARERSGVGQRVNVKMLDAWAAFVLQEQIHNNTFLSPDAPVTPPRDMYRVFATRDGHVIGIVLLDNQFKGICRALGRADLLDDPRFARPADRVVNVGEFNAELAKDIERLTTAEFLEATRAHEVPFAPVNDLASFFEDPQVKLNKTYFDIDDAEFGPIRLLNFFAAFGGTPLDLQRRAPKLGEHTDEVLAEIGTSKEDLERLRADGLIRSS